MFVEFKLYSAAVIVQSLQKAGNTEETMTFSMQPPPLLTSFTKSSSAYVYLELQTSITLIIQLQGQNSKLLY